MGTARRPPSSLGGQKPLTITERERELVRSIKIALRIGSLSHVSSRTA